MDLHDIADRNPMVRDMLERVAERLNEQSRKAAQADPEGQKTINLFDNDPNSYRYRGKELRGGKREYWCYATKRNVAGYFLGWREIEDKDGNCSLDSFFARKVKKVVIDRCKMKASVA